MGSSDSKAEDQNPEKKGREVLYATEPAPNRKNRSMSDTRGLGVNSKSELQNGKKVQSPLKLPSIPSYLRSKVEQNSSGKAHLLSKTQVLPNISNQQEPKILQQPPQQSQNAIQSPSVQIPQPQPQNSSQSSSQPSTLVSAMKLSQALKVTIQTLNSKKQDILVSKNMTGGQLKQYIYDNISNSLKPDQMSIKYQGTVIGKNKKLDEIQIVVGSQLKVVQEKIQIGEIQNIIADVHGIDLISEEVGVAEMSCGHKIGRDTMTALVKSLINCYKYEIKCPYPDENDHTCNAVWQFRQCKKVGVFTAEEIQEFESGLSMNWMREYSKVCPNPQCNHQICKIDMKTNRVVCPRCRYGDFCYNCLKLWKGSGSDFCGNEQCKFFVDFLAKCPWNKRFELRDTKDGGKVKCYNAPQFRACPHCSLIFEHKMGCKHMTCKSCGTKFCWLCLQKLKNGSWPCGSFDEYCGKVEQAQSIG